MRIYKFDGNATASVRGMQHVAKLIQDNTSKIVVLSAPKDVTKHLGEVAASFFNRNIEEAHDKITRLEFQFIDFANELLTNDTIKHEAIRGILDCFQAIWKYSMEPFYSTDEKEILFPEMTALIIGLLIIDKRVWNVKRWQIILLMTLGAAVGICIVRYSPLPYVVNLCAAFAFAGASLLISRATLIPLISACVLPVLLHTESIVYPIAVFSMSVSVVFVQIILEKCGIRNRMPKSVDRKPSKEDIIRWLILFCFVGALAGLAVGMD